jgi:transposase
MSKHSRELKLQLAQAVQDTASYKVGNIFNICSRQIRYWSFVYRIHGNASFKHSDKPYSKTFKLQAIQTMQSNNWSMGYTSAYFDLSSPGILYQWIKRYSEGGSDTLTPQRKGRPAMTLKPRPQKPFEQMSEKEMREELEYLRAENDVLKKLEALAQQRKQKSKTKP